MRPRISGHGYPSLPQEIQKLAGRSLCAPQARATSPVSAFQEGWALLVCSGWWGISRTGRRDDGPPRVVLDRLACRLRQAARLTPLWKAVGRGYSFYTRMGFELDPQKSEWNKQ